MNYYNEFNPHAAQWLRNLIAAELVPNGHVDDRSIRDVRPGDLRGYTQCHFFAGIGGWSRALELAGWPAERPVWTGSCPCQPYSVAGKGEGANDERDLWPIWAALIAKRRPSTIFGEQVASAIGHGWLDRAASDLESQGYAVGAAVLPACATVNAPHRRERLWFVAHANGDRCQARHEAAETVGHGRPSFADGRPRDELADAGSQHVGMGWQGRFVDDSTQQRQAVERNGGDGDFWQFEERLVCADGKTRRVKPGVCLLVDGLPRHVAASIAGYGNAIVPQVAAQFIQASDGFRSPVTLN